MVNIDRLYTLQEWMDEVGWKDHDVADWIAQFLLAEGVPPRRATCDASSISKVRRGKMWVTKEKAIAIGVMTRGMVPLVALADPVGFPELRNKWLGQSDAG